MKKTTALRAESAAAGLKLPPPGAVIYIFLTGEPSQHDTFDLKPDATCQEFLPDADKSAPCSITAQSIKL